MPDNRQSIVFMTPEDALYRISLSGLISKFKLHNHDSILKVVRALRRGQTPLFNNHANVIDREIFEEQVADWVREVNCVMCRIDGIGEAELPFARIVPWLEDQEGSFCDIGEIAKRMIRPYGGSWIEGEVVEPKAREQEVQWKASYTVTRPDIFAEQRDLWLNENC